jgi:O-antigen/teichoic acid export membrane protein/glycosyltransferase involved in cell wall biosynthesis
VSGRRKTTAATIGTGACGQLALVLSGVLSARLLGVHDRGQLALLVVVPSALTVLTSLGLPFALTFFMARDVASSRRVLAQVRPLIAIQLAATAAIHVAVLTALIDLGSLKGWSAAVLTIPSSAALLAQQYGQGILQGQHAFRAFNISRLLPALLYALAVLATTVAGGDSLASFGLAWTGAVVAAAIVTGMWALYAMPRENPGEHATSLIPAREIVRFGLRGLIGASVSVENFQIDQLAVGLALGPGALGIYVVAAALTNVPRFVSQAIGMVAFPDVAYAANRGSARRLAASFVWLSLLMLVPLVIALELATPTLVRLFFGAQFAGSIPIARILLLAATAVGIRRVLADVFRGAGHPGYGSVAEIASWLALGGALAGLLGPYGTRGVAWSMCAAAVLGLLTIALLGVLGPNRARRNLLPGPWGRRRLVGDAALRRRLGGDLEAGDREGGFQRPRLNSPRRLLDRVRADHHSGRLYAGIRLVPLLLSSDTVRPGHAGVGSAPVDGHPCRGSNLMPKRRGSGRGTQLLLQTAAPRYHMRLFVRLHEGSPGVVIAAGGRHFDPSVVTSPDLEELLTPIHNHFLFSRRLLWQTGHWRLALGAEKAILEFNPRILSTWVLLIARRLLGRRTVLWGHAWPRRGPQARTDYLREVMRRLGTAIIVYTESEAQALRRKMPAKEIIAAPNAIFLRGEIGAQPTEVPPTDFVFVGRLVPAKRPDLLFSAFLAAVHDLPDWSRLVLVGDGPQRQELEHLAAGSRVSERIQFRGELNDYESLRVVYASAVASISPGYVGLSLTQSLSFGVPMIIASGEPHSPEFEAAVPGENAAIFKGGSVEDLAGQLVEFARNRDAWWARRDEIALWCAERYSIELMAGRVLEALEGPDSA